MRSIRSLLSAVVPTQSLEAKWMPRYERRQIRRYRRESVPSNRRVDIEVMKIGDEYKALMNCKLGSTRIVSWLLPAIQEPAVDWQELAGLAAEIIGISNSAHIHQLNQAVGGLGTEHYLLLQVAGTTYRRLPEFQVEKLVGVDF
jgi:hypothetical protein